MLKKIEEITLSNSFYEASILLIPKSNKDNAFLLAFPKIPKKLSIE